MQRIQGGRTNPRQGRRSKFRLFLHHANQVWNRRCRHLSKRPETTSGTGQMAIASIGGNSEPIFDDALFLEDLIESPAQWGRLSQFAQ